MLYIFVYIAGEAVVAAAAVAIIVVEAEILVVGIVVTVDPELILSRVGVVTVDRVWIGWLDLLTTFYTPLGITGNYSVIAISTLYNSPFHTQQCPQSITL
jgi:hypothetical protein